MQGVASLWSLSIERRQRHSTQHIWIVTQPSPKSVINSLTKDIWQTKFRTTSSVASNLATRTSRPSSPNDPTHGSSANLSRASSTWSKRPRQTDRLQRPSHQPPCRRLNHLSKERLKVWIKNSTTLVQMIITTLRLDHRKIHWATSNIQMITAMAAIMVI